MIHQHVRVLGRGGTTVDDGGLVVEFNGIGHRQDGCRARLDPERLLITDPPVEDVCIACFRQQVAGDQTRGEIGREPARRALAGVLREALGHLRDHRAFLGFGHLDLALGIGATVGDDLVFPLPMRLQQLGVVAIVRGVDHHPDGYLELLEQVEQFPAPDAIAVRPQEIRAGLERCARVPAM